MVKRPLNTLRLRRQHIGLLVQDACIALECGILTFFQKLSEDTFSGVGSIQWLSLVSYIISPSKFVDVLLQRRSEGADGAVG